MRALDVAAAGSLVLSATFLVSQFLAPKFDSAQSPSEETVTVAAPNTNPAFGYLGANAAQLRREDDGHYWATADVDGTAVKFMVDTGASTVALTYRDAQRIGLRPESLDYSWSIRTAGGEVKGASVQLDSVMIGRVQVSNVEAMVLRDGLDQSLLGMTFLGELESYEFRGSHLILRR